jgi:hypothetical protein
MGALRRGGFGAGGALGNAQAPPQGEGFTTFTDSNGSEQFITVTDLNGVEQRLTVYTG